MAGRDPHDGSYEHPERSPTVVTMSKLIPGRSATIEGRVTEVEDVPNGTEPFTRWSSATTAGRSVLPCDRGTVVRKSFPVNCCGSPGRRAKTTTAKPFDGRPRLPGRRVTEEVTCCDPTGRRPSIPPSIGDRFKRALLGRPLIREPTSPKLCPTRLPRAPLADAISSVAYGPEQIMVELLPHAGWPPSCWYFRSRCHCAILALVTASYRQVVMAYTRAGGSYVVARENLGPRVAQMAAAALLIDYVVTVAVKPAAGTVAWPRRYPQASSLPPGNRHSRSAADVLCQLARVAAVRPGIRRG